MIAVELVIVISTGFIVAILLAESFQGD